MLSTSAIKIACGIACILFSWLVLRRLAPQDGKAPSAWTRTDLRACAMAMFLVILMVAGGALIAQGALS